MERIIRPRRPGPATVAVEEKTPESHNPRDAYLRHRDAMAKRMREAAESIRDIGALPAIEDLPRRIAAEASFERFCLTYFPRTFHMPFSDDHRTVIGAIETTIAEGGQAAIAMPRGSGKSSLLEAAVIYALLRGQRRFAILISSDEGHAVDSLESIKSELENNERLAADFPEACFPIQALEHVTQRASGQLYQGRPTHICWTQKQIVLPTMTEIPLSVLGDASKVPPSIILKDTGAWNSPASGAVIRVSGLTGHIRGAKFKRPDGSPARPDIALIDDPQTEDSARSLSQCDERERIINGAVMGLPEPGEEIAVFAAVTVILPGDLADRILDRDKNPVWHGRTTRLMDAMPSDERLWAKYAEMRREEDRYERPHTASKDFYRTHRAAMDAGARPAWAERYKNDELSAVQHAMNLRIDKGDATFYAEYQNDPLKPQPGDTPAVDVEAIAHKLHGLPRGVVPVGGTWVTGFVDVQDNALYWACAAWAEDFTGAVIDYGIWPEQHDRHAAYAKLRMTLRRQYPKAGREGAIVHGLTDLVDALSRRRWPRDDGAELTTNLIMVDSGYEMRLVQGFCRASAQGARVIPSRGFGISAAMKPMTEYDGTRGDRVGYNWLHERIKGGSIRQLRYDTNFWKTWIHKHLDVSMGDPGSLSLYGQDPREHDTFSQHLTAESPAYTAGQGREVWQWKLFPGRDNHWLDCVVGCAVAASFLGAATAGTGEPAKSARTIKWSEIQRQKRFARAGA